MASFLQLRESKHERKTGMGRRRKKQGKRRSGGRDPALAGSGGLPEQRATAVGDGGEAGNELPARSGGGREDGSKRGGGGCWLDGVGGWWRLKGLDRVRAWIEEEQKSDGWWSWIGRGSQGGGDSGLAAEEDGTRSLEIRVC